MSDAPVQRTINLWFGLSIVTTICCCLPFGIVGIVYSAKAMSDVSRGDFSGAEWNAQRAKNWTIAGIVLGLIVGIGVIGSGSYR